MRQMTSRQPVSEFGQFLAWTAAVLSVGAGVIHLAAAREHFEASLAHGLFFIVIAGLQLLWAALITRRPTSPLLLAGLLGNGLIVAVQLFSRTSGMPFGAASGSAETLGLRDGLATAFELLIISIGAYLLIRQRGPAEGPGGLRNARRALVGVSSLVFLLTTLTFTPLAGPDTAPSRHQGGELVIHDTNDGHGDQRAHDHTASDDRADADDHATHHPPAEDAHGAMAAGSFPSSHDHSGSHSGDASHTDFHSHVFPFPGDLPAQEAGTAPPAAAPGNPGELRTTVRYGPFFLPASALGGSNIPHFNRILTDVAKPCADCYITGMFPDLVYEDGSSANLDTGPMLHHAVWMQGGRADATCGEETATLLGPFSGPLTGGERFFAAGNERTAVMFPQGFGYYVSGNPLDPWSMVVELMNYSETARTVYLNLEVTYQPASKAATKKVTPLWLDQDNCGDSEYSVPAGPYHSEWRWVSNVTGRVVSSIGHVHDGGVKTVLANSATGREICSSVAGYGSKPAYMGSIESMSHCFWDSLGTVRAGETLALTTYYNSTVPADNVMGIMLAYVYETTDLDGGTPPPAEATPAPPEEATPPPPPHHH